MVDIRNFTPRLYQETILATCARTNCLIILPTGLGKTKTAILAAVQRLKTFPNSKVLFLTVTKPLADQICNEVKECTDIDGSQIELFTGLVKPEKREELWKNAVFIVSTPQCIQNDLIGGRISLEDVSLLIADEAHNAVKDYAYTWIAQQYHSKANYPRIIGLTASPGSDLEKIKEVCKNLYIEEIETRTDKDPDVAPYTHEVNIEWVKVELPPLFKEVQKFLKDFLGDRTGKLKDWGILQRKDISVVSKTDLLALQAQIRGRIAYGEKDFTLWNAISVLAEIMKVQHALELLETQGIFALNEYLAKLQKEGYSSKTKAIKNIIRDLNFRSAVIKTERLHEQGFQHPKLIELQKLVEKEIKGNEKIIVFNQYRDNALNIVRELNKIEGVKAQLFVGQLKKGETGLSQKEQMQALDEFRQGGFNVLVATSIGEQGLDIPQVSLVIFYEPIPSAIRQIQRRGRTGRHEKGKVIIMVTKDTRDEGYMWSAHHKEKRMYRSLAELKSKLALEPQQKLEKFVPEGEKIKIFADHREGAGATIKELAGQGISIKLETLDTADYLLSRRCGVEVKTTEDFVNSIIDGRLLHQAKELRKRFERPLLMIEGEQDIYSVRNIHPNAIRGVLATIAVSYGIPILHTKNSRETAALLVAIAKREQDEVKKDFSPHADRKPLTLKEQQEYIVSALPSVGPVLAKELLKSFKSVNSVVNAGEEELKKVEGVGEKKARAIRDAVEGKYE